MAQKIKITLVCDRSGEEGGDVRTHRFGWEGQQYETDLNAWHGAELAGIFMRQLIPHARKAGRAVPPAAGRDRERNARIRAWAKEHGIAVSERGRIPAAVAAGYDAAH